MMGGRCVAAVVVILVLVSVVRATNKCVWAVGRVECKRFPAVLADTEIRLYDQDGGQRHVFDRVDPDDLMGVTFAEEDGRFRVEGCAKDHDWLPWLPNDPDPYLTIRHHCRTGNSDDAPDVIYLRKFRVFVPHTYYLNGPVSLD